ncbi:unnamed protein product [Cyclocybe aegerita]|uniref:Uncharacterized protein n=1 Tax=Cyclocybe aegerita TaxID=1973307 RepID=A0A8S0W1J2_CYCAE|nr:unnamed protein product [Cyclocybe aegerita]
MDPSGKYDWRHTEQLSILKANYLSTRLRTAIATLAKTHCDDHDAPDVSDFIETELEMNLLHFGWAALMGFNVCQPAFLQDLLVSFWPPNRPASEKYMAINRAIANLYVDFDPLIDKPLVDEVDRAGTYHWWTGEGSAPTRTAIDIYFQEWVTDYIDAGHYPPTGFVSDPTDLPMLQHLALPLEALCLRLLAQATSSGQRIATRPPVLPEASRTAAPPIGPHDALSEGAVALVQSRRTSCTCTHTCGRSDPLPPLHASTPMLPAGDIQELLTEAEELSSSTSAAIARQADTLSFLSWQHAAWTALRNQYQASGGTIVDPEVSQHPFSPPANQHLDPSPSPPPRAPPGLIRRSPSLEFIESSGSNRGGTGTRVSAGRATEESPSSSPAKFPPRSGSKSPSVVEFVNAGANNSNASEFMDNVTRVLSPPDSSSDSQDDEEDSESEDDDLLVDSTFQAGKFEVEFRYVSSPLLLLKLPLMALPPSTAHGCRCHLQAF